MYILIIQPYIIKSFLSLHLPAFAVLYCEICDIVLWWRLVFFFSQKSKPMPGSTV